MVANEKDGAERLPLSVIVGANVYRRRTWSGPLGIKLSQAALATKAGTTTETIRRIESGRDPSHRQFAIRLDTLEGIAAALGCNVIDLLDFDSATRVNLNRTFAVIRGGNQNAKRARQYPLVAPVLPI